MMEEWIIYASIVAAISFFIVVLMHMLANAFSLQGVTLWVKSEYMQVAVSFLLIAFAASLEFGGIAVWKDVTRAVALNSGNVELGSAMAAGLSNPSEIGKAYLKSVILCEGWLYKTVFTLNYWFEGWSKLSIEGLGLEAVASGFGLSGVSVFSFINNNLVYLVLFQYIQYNVLQISQYTMLQAFLPIGLALRAFPLTRGVGGFVTAFAIGFAFVYPMSYVLIVAIMPNIHGPCTEIVNLQSSFEYQFLTSEQPCFSNRGDQVENLYKLKIAERGLGSYLSFIGNLDASLMFMQGLFYPLASLIMTFSFVRQAGSLFGADLAEIGRGLIKIL